MAKGGFRGMPGGMNQAAMLKQAQKMQQEMLRMQEEQENKTFTAKAGGGMVAATVNGKHEVVELTINPRGSGSRGRGNAAGHGHGSRQRGYAHR